MQHVMFVELNRTSSGAEYVRAARDLGFRITLATSSRARYEGMQVGKAALMDLIDYVVDVDTHHDVDGLCNVLDRYAQEHPIDVVLGSLDLEVVQAAQVARFLGVLGCNPEAVRRCRDKSLTRMALRDAGVPSVRFARVMNVSEAQAAGDSLGYPCVLKPLDCMGSEGVVMIHSADEFEDPIHAHSSLQKADTTRRKMRALQHRASLGYERDCATSVPPVPRIGSYSYASDRSVSAIVVKASHTIFVRLLRRLLLSIRFLYLLSSAKNSRSDVVPSGCASV